jgi:hypothetical protein
MENQRGLLGKMLAKSLRYCTVYGILPILYARQNRCLLLKWGNA